MAAATAFNAGNQAYLETAPSAAAAAGFASIQALAGSNATNMTAITRARISNFQRTFNFGGLATMVLTEDRLGFRTSGEAVSTDGYYSVAGGLDCPQCPTSSAACLGGAVQQFLAAQAGAPGYVYPDCSPELLGFLAATGGTTNYVNFTAAQVATGKQFVAALELLNVAPYGGNTAQHLIGTGPALYVGSQFAQSSAAGTPFQVWMSQTVFQPVPWPDLVNSTAQGRPTSKSVGPYLTPNFCGSASFAPVCFNSLTGGTFESDNWDGFNVERNFVLAMLAQGSTPIINSGDSHSFWLGTVTNTTYFPGPTAPAVVEFGGGSVTTFGWGDAFCGTGGPCAGFKLGETSAFGAFPDYAFLNYIEVRPESRHRSAAS